MKEISKFLFKRTVTPDLELSLDAYSKRQKVIANNIANANTPGFKAQRVEFEEEYKKYLDPLAVRGIRTHPAHKKIGAPKQLSEVKPTESDRLERRNDSGFNDVDIDHEMAKLAENNIRYEASLNILKKQFALLRSSIKGK